MARKKAELESDSECYRAAMAKSREAEARGLYRRAVDHAMEAWPFIDGMLQFEKRYGERPCEVVDAVELVLRYAPLLLDMELLNRIEKLVDEVRRIKRDADEDVGSRLRSAREMALENHRLWSLLEAKGEYRQDKLREALGGDQRRWRDAAEGWDRMGLVSRTKDGGSYRVSLATRMNQVISAKCPNCGALADAPKAMLLDPTTCPACRREGAFVLLG